MLNPHNALAPIHTEPWCELMSWHGSEASVHCQGMSKPACPPLSQDPHLQAVTQHMVRTDDATACLRNTNGTTGSVWVAPRQQN